MILKPIGKTLEENEEFLRNPLCREVITMTIDFHKRVGFIKPWIGYFAEVGGHIVGSGGFKGKPVNETIEISYGIFEEFRKQGFGTEVCRKLVELSLRTDPSLRITARTLPEKSFSTRILEKNNFVFAGIVDDPEDGEVWEWELTK